MATQPKPFPFTAADLERLRAARLRAAEALREAIDRGRGAAEEGWAARAELDAARAKMWATLARCQKATAVRPFGPRP